MDAKDGVDDERAQKDIVGNDRGEDTENSIKAYPRIVDEHTQARKAQHACRGRPGRHDDREECGAVRFVLEEAAAVSDQAQHE